MSSNACRATLETMVICGGGHMTDDDDRRLLRSTEQLNQQKQGSESRRWGLGRCAVGARVGCTCLATARWVARSFASPFYCLTRGVEERPVQTLFKPLKLK